MSTSQIHPHEKRLLQSLNRLYVIPMASTRADKFVNIIRDYLEEHKVVEEREKVVYRWRTVKKIVSARPGELPIDTIERIVKEVLGLLDKNLSSRTRKREIVFARQLVHYFARFHTEMSHREIGERYGGFDHTTVINSVKTIDNYLDIGYPVEYVAAIKKVSELLNDELHKN